MFLYNFLFRFLLLELFLQVEDIIAFYPQTLKGVSLKTKDNLLHNHNTIITLKKSDHILVSDLYSILKFHKSSQLCSFPHISPSNPGPNQNSDFVYSCPALE